MTDHLKINYKNVDDDYSLLEVVENNLYLDKPYFNKLANYSVTIAPRGTTYINSDRDLFLCNPAIIRIPTDTEILDFLKSIDGDSITQKTFKNIPYDRSYTYRGTSIYLTKIFNHTLVMVAGDTITDRMRSLGEHCELNTDDSHDTKYYVYGNKFTRLNISSPGACLVTLQSFDTVCDLMSGIFFSDEPEDKDPFWDYSFYIKGERLNAEV